MYKSVRNQSWKMQICLFFYVDVCFIFCCFQIVHLLVFYLYNISLSDENVMIILTILSDSLLCVTGLLLVTYYRDIFFLTAYIGMNIGLICGNGTGGLTNKEQIAYISLASFSLTCIVYSLLKYGRKVLGEETIEVIQVGHNEDFEKKEKHFLHKLSIMSTL